MPSLKSIQAEMGAGSSTWRIASYSARRSESDDASKAFFMHARCGRNASPFEVQSRYSILRPSPDSGVPKVVKPRLDPNLPRNGTRALAEQIANFGSK
jgi:hypothetical protein